MIAKPELMVLGVREASLFVGTRSAGSVRLLRWPVQRERASKSIEHSLTVLLYFLSSSSLNNSTFFRRESTTGVEMRL